MPSVGHHDVATEPPPQLDGDVRLPLPGGDRRHAYWERQTHAIVSILGAAGIMTVDEMRRCIEGLEESHYVKASYYEKWATAVAMLLLERNVFTNLELEAKLGVWEEPSPEDVFTVGSVVRVRPSSHRTRWRKPHLRTPGFVHGLCGVVDRCVGSFPNPEELAFGGKASSKLPLYVVRFDWGSVCDFALQGGVATDAVTCEIYHSWLLPAIEADLEAQRQTMQRKRQASGDIGEHPDCKRARHEEGHGSHAHGHSHSHDHGHEAHEERVVVEQRAVEAEIPCPAIAQALVDVLIDKGLVTAAKLRETIEKIDTADTKRGVVGRRLVARAWVDPAFKARLLKNANSACSELGIQASNAHVHTEIVVAEQTDEEHHLIVCTLCSCYPLSLLGLSPDWYKSREYRARAVREPRALLKDFGTEVPATKRVVVHDSTADCRYMILPQRPANTEGWTEAELETLVSRDSMIGVTVLPDVAASKK